MPRKLPVPVALAMGMVISATHTCGNESRGSLPPLPPTPCHVTGREHGQCLAQERMLP